MKLPIAKPGEKFFVEVRRQKKGNNFTNGSITDGLNQLGIAEESTQDEVREVGLKKVYEVPESFVATLLKRVEVYRPFFKIFHSLNGEGKKEYLPRKEITVGKKQVRKSALRF